MNNYLQIKIEGEEIEIKLFIISKEFRQKIFKAIQKDGISIFNQEWGHYPIKNKDE